MLRNMVGLKPAAAPKPEPEIRPQGFAALVEGEIIPRLVVAHSRDDLIEINGQAGTASITGEEAAAFAPLALDHDACALLDRIEGFLARGVSVDTIFVELLAPAARHLGVMWEEDDADFVAVTMALWRLQEVVRELSARVPVRHGNGEPLRRALFSVMPGEDHSFGTVIVEDVFRRAGWMTDIVTQCDTSQLLARVAASEYDLIGLTVTGDRHCETVPSVINGLRSVSRNPHVGVMVGGRVFNDDPALASQLGADATAADAASALVVARDLVDGRANLYEFSD
jgi:MerR family transcriptional regulator, light-induced transcriptional regulator